MMDRMADRRASPRLEFSAGGLVFDDEGRVLLIRARDLRNQTGVDAAEGRAHPGESSIDAALREVQEETGYRCELVRELTPVTYWFQRGGRRIRKTVRWYLMRPIAKVGEHDHEVDEVCGPTGRRPRPGCATTPTAGCSPPRPERARRAAPRRAATDRSRHRY